MKHTTTLRSLLAALFSLAIVQTGLGQESVPTAGTAVTQNFNGMGSSATASLPTGWKMGTDWSTGATATAAAAGTSGTGALASNSSGNFYNFANGVTASSTDRAIGFLTSNSYTSPRSIIYAFKNDTGGAVTSITVSWNYEKYRSGSRAFDWTFFHGSTSAASTAAADGNQSYAADASNTVISNPPASTAKSVTLTGLNIAAGATYYLRWTYTGSGGSSSAQGLGIDDFSITLTGAAATPSITIGGNTSATATAFTTTYGTASANQSFTIAGSDLTADISVAAVTGFEYSIDGGSTWGTTRTIARSGTTASATLRVRLAATAAVSGSYNNQSINLSSTGATTRTISTASSGNSVTAKGLTITGLSAANKNWDGTTTVSVTGTPAYSGLVNSESFSVTGAVTWAFPDANVGTNKTLTRTGSFNAPSSNYTVTQPTLTASIAAVAPGAPTDLSLTPGNGQLTASFTAPASNGGSAITNYEYSINGGSTFTAVSPASTSTSIVITSLSNGTSYNVQVRAVNAAGSGTATASVAGTPAAPSSPTISVSPATFVSALSTTYGTASSTANFTVSGSTLSGNLTVTAPTGLEVSLSSGSEYADSLNLTATSGTVTATTVYARLKATAAAGNNYNSQSISVFGGGASTQSVATTATGNTVSQKVVTITGLGATGKVYDGTTSVTITGAATYDGLANEETHSVTDSVTWSFPDKSIGTGKVLTQSASYTAPNANYSLPAQPSLTADITAKELTGSFTAINKAFDNTTAATVASRAVGGAIDGDTVNHTGGTATFSDVNVGDNKTVTLASATLTGADAGNYTLTSVSTTTADITQGAAEITFAALPEGKKVGDAAFSAGATATLGATISYSSSNTAVATVNASTGLITLVAPGVTTITATVAGTANFTGDTKSQTLNVGGAGGNLNLASDLIITGIIDGPRTGGTPKAIEIYVAKDVADLSIYKVQNYGNGSNTADTPVALSGVATAGDYLYVASESTQFTSYFGFAPDFVSSALNVNGNDVVALTKNDTLVDVFGTIGENPAVDTTFNYQDTWFYRKSNTEPSSTFTLTDWTFAEGQSDALDSLGTSGVNPAIGNALRMPVGTYTISTPGTPGITATGSFAAVTTTYGTASAASATTATVTGGSLTADITATAPAGFQVSSDGTTYGATATFTQTDGFANGTLYLRLAADAAAGAYNSQVVTLSSTGASNQTVAIANSTVSPKALTVTNTSAITKVYDGSNSAAFTGDLVGVVGADDVSLVGTGTYASVNVGTGLNVTSTSTLTGAAADNYSLTQPTGLTGAITAKGLTIGAPTLTTSKAYDGNTTAAVTAGSLSGVESGDTVTVSASAAYDNASVGTGKTITVTYALDGAASGNYSAPDSTQVSTGAITKATPTISAAPAASAITYGQTLASSELTGGTASVAGSFAFTTTSTAPNAGTASQSVTFTPTDTANYNTATTTVSVTTSKATPTIATAPTASGITFGQTLADSSLTGGSASTDGTFAFTTPGTTPAVGTASQEVTFTPTDTDNYNNATTMVNVTVNSGADPLFAADGESPTITIAPGVANIAFTGIPGRTYGIQRSTTLATDSWTQIDTVTADPETGATTYQDQNRVSPAAFYRIVYPPAEAP